ncbi:teichoic acid poly(glycerol phosphate) polymerase [Paraliobacillus ryukyuensis]|uniref:CDP-glycerol glycerophosphotransferase (TagB/SpsB family) n=1 Tax=Paraliobacillus ryukyuensis TaxID=200904 RepID=A0A366EGL0_9BACI|nr:CDP-glycerol glycerophosphotransferase (TagB/SpsB family) [Paraliobacillus ryukyuensis]
MQLLKKIIMKILKRKWVTKLYYLLFSLIGTLPVKKNVIIFESFLGKQYSDNPRAIYEFMIKNNYHENYKLYWSIDARNLKKIEGYQLNVLARFSIKWLLIMPRAQYWIVNSRLPLWIPKPKHTKYVQTWHGTPLKKLAADMKEVHMPGTNTEKYKLNFLYEANKWDYLISPNQYSTTIFKRAFQFKKKIIESGYPRNDYLYQHNNEKSIRILKKTLRIPLDKKVILYAPTWRDNNYYAKGKYKFNLELNLKQLYQEFGDQYVILLRMHYLVAESIDTNGFESFVYDYSKYDDIRDLYIISDILITDYSSVFFDFANLQRPMLFFVYDIESYRDNLRGFYLDFEKAAPGPLVKTTEELIEQIKDIENDQFSYQDKMENFLNEFCYLEDGKASKRVFEQITKS